jgi:hypothetical protein
LLQDNHNRVYAVSLTDISREKLVVKRFQNVSRVMVWSAISKKMQMDLNSLDYFAWEYTQLHKTHEFGQIQNLLEKDSGRNATTTGACRSKQNFKLL